MLHDALTAMLLSLKVAGWATFISAMLGVALAYCITRMRPSLWREALDTLLTLPMVLPPTVLGYYLLVLCGSQGPLGLFLKNTLGISLIFTWQGAVLAATVVSLPLVFKPARAAFESVDLQYRQAAAVLGIHAPQIFFRVTLPLAWRGILSGILLAFARAMGEFGATLMIAGSIRGKTQTLSIAVYEAVQAGQDQLATALVIFMSLICIIILLSASYLFKHEHGARLV